MKSKNPFLNFVLPHLTTDWQNLSELKRKNEKIEFAHLDELTQYGEIKMRIEVVLNVHNRPAGSRHYWRIENGK